MKTKIFNGYLKVTDNINYFISADDELNEFLLYENVIFIDVKYSTQLIDGEIFSSILLIYK